jgi:hypothetical protein
VVARERLVDHRFEFPSIYLFLATGAPCDEPESIRPSRRFFQEFQFTLRDLDLKMWLKRMSLVEVQKNRNRDGLTGERSVRTYGWRARIVALIGITFNRKKNLL